jgi:hypothetical protein
MDKDKNGWSLPTFAKVGIVGVLCFILLAQLGLIPYLPSPIIGLRDAIAEHNRQTVHPLRLICHKMWEGHGDTQRRCWE